MSNAGHHGGNGVPTLPDTLEREVAEIRGNLGDLVSELDHRRHEVFALRRQIRRHPLYLAIAGVAVLGLVGAAVALAVDRRHRQRSALARMHRLRGAFGRMADHPERVARETPDVARKVAGAAGAAIASALARKLAKKWLKAG